MIRRIVSSAALAVVAFAAVAAPVSAHIDPDPNEAQAGSRLNVGFTVEHGCDGSPTLQLDMRLPDGVTDAVTEPVDGWTGSVETEAGDTIVSFVGGPLADDVEGTFGVTMTLPPTADTTIYFPFVQRCEVGEIRWIGIPAAPGDELDEPAPAMLLFGPVATPVPPTTAAPAPIDAPTTTEAPSTTEAPATTEPPPVTTEATSDTVTIGSEPVVVSSGASSGGGSNTGTIAFVLSVGAVIVLGSYVFYRGRTNKAAAIAAAAAAASGDAPADAS